MNMRMTLAKMRIAMAAIEEDVFEHRYLQFSKQRPKHYDDDDDDDDDDNDEAGDLDSFGGDDDSIADADVCYTSTDDPASAGPTAAA